MKNTTKVNFLFAFLVTTSFLLSYVLRLIPLSGFGVNARVVFSQATLLIPALLYLMILKPETASNIRFSFLNIKSNIIIILITFLVMPFVSLVNNISMIFVDNKISGTIDAISGNPLPVNIMLIGIIPALCEEFLFRGLIFHGYKKRNPLRAMVLSGFLFGLIHFNVNQFIYAFMMGTFFSLMVYVTNSLWSSVLSHMVFNTFNVVIAYLAKDQVASTKKVTDAAIFDAYIGLTIFAVIGLVLVFALFKKLCKYNRGLENVKKIFDKKKRNEYDDEEGKFFDPYLITGIAMSIIFIVLHGI